MKQNETDNLYRIEKESNKDIKELENERKVYNYSIWIREN